MPQLIHCLFTFLAGAAAMKAPALCSDGELPGCQTVGNEGGAGCCQAVSVAGRAFGVIRKCDSGSSSGGCSFEVYPVEGGRRLDGYYEGPFWW